MNRFLLWLNAGLLVGSCILWVAAAMFGWLESVAFVSHISMLALLVGAISGVAAAKAACEAKVAVEESRPD